MHVCLFVYIDGAHAGLGHGLPRLRPGEYINTYVCMYVYVYICIYMYVCVCIYICVCVCVCIYVCIYGAHAGQGHDVPRLRPGEYINTYVCMYVYVYICIYMGLGLTLNP